MIEQLILDAVRKAMLEKYPEFFTSGNVHVVEYPVCSTQNGQECYQVYPAGASFSGEGGGNLWRRQSIGVRCYLKRTSDELSTYVELTRQMTERRRRVIKCLHQHYEAEIDMQEPFFIESISASRAVEDGAGGTYAYTDLTFRAMFISSLAEVQES